MSALLDLAARVEALSGPDREVDRDIADALGLGPPADWSRLPRNHNGCVNMDCGSWISPSGGRIRHSERYTASLDTAMALVPDGADHWPQIIMTGTNPNNPAKDKERVEIWCNGRKPVRANAATPALALTAAALRAKAGQP